METERQRIARVTSEPIAIVDYDESWPMRFEQERHHLLECLPEDIVVRIEHFGSTAIPGLAAKPVIDMMVEVKDLQAVQERVVPVLQGQGYEYFWRPTFGDEGAPFYAWFIKRDPHSGERTHHIHMVEASFAEHWDRLLFRDYLIENPEVAQRYEQVKRAAAEASPTDRVAYTHAKTRFITEVTEQAKAHYR